VRSDETNGTRLLSRHPPVFQRKRRVVRHDSQQAWILEIRYTVPLKDGSNRGASQAAITPREAG
jgi:hypothetical protein